MKTNRKLQVIEPLEQRIAPALTAASINLGALTALTGGSLAGVSNNDNLGTSVSAAGDINGDGIGDFIVGAPFAEHNGGAPGAAYVVFGKESGIPLNLTASGLNGTNGFTIFGAQDGERFGTSVSGAGDVNGDGFADVIIGSPLNDGNSIQRGEAFVVYGHEGGFSSSITTADLDGHTGFAILGPTNQSFLGTSVSKAGDVNGDGFGDVIVGATGANGDMTGSGAAFVIFGKANVPAKIFTSILADGEGTKLGGIATNDQAGRSVSGGGDLNGDGFDDVIVGASQANEGGISRGAAYVVYGKSNFTKNTPLSGLGGASGFRLSGEHDGDQAGYSVQILGDLNGDGLAEAGVGAPLANEGAVDSGAVYVLYGKSAGTGNTALSSINGSNAGFKLTGAGASNYLGSDLDAGDVNGDGRGDLIIGAPGATSNGVSAGATYVVYGKAGGFASVPAVGSLDGQNGLTLVGSAAGDNAGHSVAFAGDVNHDGFGDILVGSFFKSNGGTQRGDAEIVYGGLSGSAAIQPTFSADHKSATFHDVDGDLVTVKVTKGDLTTADFDLVGSNDHASFLSLKLPGSFAGANVTISAKATLAGGDGHVNLGTFDATGIDLGVVTIGGNVERFTAGDANAPALSVKSLTVDGLGAGALPVHDTFGDTYLSSFADSTGAITVKGDIHLGSVNVSGNLAKLTVGGSVLGGDTLFSGLIQTTAGGNIGPVKIGHDLHGGAGAASGGINSAGKVASVTIGGSQIGDNEVSGYLIAAGNIGPVKIGLDQRNGLISSLGTIGNITVGGSLIQDHPDALAGIKGTQGVGSVLVKGSIEGLADSPYQIHGGGPLTGKTSVAIKSLTVLGSVENAAILGGDLTSNGHAQIGAIKVSGDWIASSVAAGVKTSANSAAPELFGNGDDVFYSGGTSGVIARIASITIKGAVKGTADGGDHFGFVAGQIGALQVGATKYNLAGAASAGPIELGISGDFTARELA